ncbi:hypothetical protein NNO_1795 [Hydrogenimonas sp.]|nr:hypothetical protein NNO_1795 [Hydrogenimonas sp.]
MRKMSKVTAALLLGATLSLYAADTTVETDVVVESSIDAQIEQIKNADPDQRRELMNNLKEELANMNSEERMEVISKLRESMNVSDGEQVAQQARVRTRTQSRIRTEESVQNMEEAAVRQQTMQMQRAGEMEQMLQRQGMDQYRDSGSVGMDGNGMPFGGPRR